MWRSILIVICAALLAAACEDEPPEGPAWFYITAEGSGLPGNKVYDLYADAAGAWFATDLGLAYNRGSTWVIYNHQGGMPADEIFGLAVCPNGDVWVATYAGAARLRGEEVKTFTTADGLPSNLVYGVAFDGAKLWFATDRGLARYDDPGFTVIKYVSGLPGNDVRDVYAVGVDRVWVGCLGGGAFYDRGEITEYTVLNNGLPSNFVYAVAARGDDAWLGTDKGVCLLRNGRVVKTYTTANSALQADIVNDLAYRAGGELWVATAGGGASRSVGEGFETFDTNRGLLSDYVLCVFGDKLGYVWLGTLTSGVSRFYD
jgi:ligand-binding sensor domain-containing protein